MEETITAVCEVIEKEDIVKAENNVDIKTHEESYSSLMKSNGDVPLYLNDAQDFYDGESLPNGEELVLTGCTGSDSGVEICGGRALSSGGGTRSCASSVVSCGSGCGSESSSLNNVPHKTKRKVNVNEPTKSRSTPPNGTSTPRTTIARGPNLATRERARSREKPTPPEKPRPAPKPRIRPTPDLPSLTRESPALRVRPTRTSTARCRTPNSPSDDKSKWVLGYSDDKGATLPRRRREGDSDRSRGLSAGRDVNIARRTPPNRPSTTMGRLSTTRSRVKIYAEISAQTVLLGEDVERALDGKEVLVARSRVEVSHKGVQADRRDSEIERLEAKLKRANESAETARAEAKEEKTKREILEKELDEERRLRQAAQAELESNSRRLLDLAGEGGKSGDCLAALESQLAAAAARSANYREEVNRLRTALKNLQQEAETNANEVRKLQRRMADSEEEAAEMQEFLTAEKSALQIALKESEDELERSRVECRQLVRVCERKKQEALAALAQLRGAGAAEGALDALSRRLRQALREPSPPPSEPLDSETEPRYPIEESDPPIDDTDPPLEEHDSPHCSTLGSLEDLSPIRDYEEASEQSSLQQLSRAIVHRQRSEADGERLAYKINLLAELLNRALAQSPTTLSRNFLPEEECQN